VAPLNEGVYATTGGGYTGSWFEGAALLDCSLADIYIALLKIKGVARIR
jgi:hypothetical protein